MSATHLAANLEDGLHRRLTPFLRTRGWLPRTISYTGYGSPDFVRVLGRVILGRRSEPKASSDAAATIREPDEALEAQRGWRSYITAPVTHLPVTVSIAGRDHATRTDRSGYIDLVVPTPGLEPGWHDVVINARAAQPTTARVRIVDSAVTLGLVSDIDDTVMVTSVPRPFIAVWNTFIRHGNARRIVPGMASMYDEILQRVPGAPMFYLSTGAWNIMPTLVQFLRRNGFPQGPMLMTDWGPTNTGWFRSGQEHKRGALRRLRAEFPDIRWVLVGDDGQHDPKVYREFASEHPGNVAAIAIRQLTPGEQVLAHGTPTATPEATRTRRTRATPEVGGRDGAALAPKLRSALHGI